MEHYLNTWWPVYHIIMYHMMYPIRAVMHIFLIYRIIKEHVQQNEQNVPNELVVHFEQATNQDQLPSYLEAVELEQRKNFTSSRVNVNMDPPPSYDSIHHI